MSLLDGAEVSAMGWNVSTGAVTARARGSMPGRFACAA